MQKQPRWPRLTQIQTESSFHYPFFSSAERASQVEQRHTHTHTLSRQPSLWTPFYPYNRMHTHSTRTDKCTHTHRHKQNRTCTWRHTQQTHTNVTHMHLETPTHCHPAVKQGPTEPSSVCTDFSSVDAMKTSDFRSLFPSLSSVSSVSHPESLQSGPFLRARSQEGCAAPPNCYHRARRVMACFGCEAGDTVAKLAQSHMCSLGNAGAIWSVWGG